MGKLLAAVTAVLTAGLIGTAAPALAEVAPFGHACTRENGVRFCPSATLAQRVPSWDGAPIDVDVTLPESGSGPWPTLVMLHGLGGSKTEFESKNPAGETPFEYEYNTNYFARKGYAVVTLTTRGFGNSCGLKPSRTPDCANAWTHLDDSRYEARDTQYLLGLLADEGITSPNAIGITGISYGAGQAMELAFLKNRIRLPNGSFAPWTSPNGTPMSIAAVYPRAGFADLAFALLPNGRFTDTSVPSYGMDTNPLGVMKMSYTTLLYLSVVGGDYLAPPEIDPTANLSAWYGRLLAGEPYRGPLIEQMIREFAYKGILTIPGTPAPLLVEDGFTDDLFTAQQALQVQNYAFSQNPNSEVSIQLGDGGHPPATNNPEMVHAATERGVAFLEAKLRGIGQAPPRGSVVIDPTVCPVGSPLAPPIEASSWQATHPGSLDFGSGAFQSIFSNGFEFFGQAEDDPASQTISFALHSQLEKLLSGASPSGAESGNSAAALTSAASTCKVYPAKFSVDTAAINGPIQSKPYTIVGMPTVSLNMASFGSDGQLDALLWDVRPDGTRILVTRGQYRLTPFQHGTVSFQLAGNAYTIAPGDFPRLEVLANDSPFQRPSNGFNISAILHESVSLPTYQVNP